MQSVRKQLDELGPDVCLSVERWLAAEHALSLTSGIKFGTLIEHINNQTSAYTDECLVLDTKAAREGLLVLPIIKSKDNQRKSSKKMAQAGDLIISRLRPYLLQVAYLPKNMEELTGHNRVFLSTEFFVFRSNDQESIAYLMPWLLSNDVQKVIQGAATGGHHPRFNLDLLTTLHVPESLYDGRKEISESVEKICADNIQCQKDLGTILGDFV